MSFKPMQFERKGTLESKAPLEKVFPLLCPKKEEEWIPGWECETLWSKSGVNEEGAIFRTLKPYGTELYWTTLRYDLKDKIVDFLITAPRLFMFRFRILLSACEHSVCMEFRQTFTSVSEEGNSFLRNFQAEDFQGRLKKLEEFMEAYLSKCG